MITSPYFEQFLDLLKDPISNQSLEYDESSNALITKTKTYKYPFVEGIPVILTNMQVTSKSNIHELYKTNFDYTQHYEKDAEVFDYQLEYENSATRHEQFRLHQYIVSKVSKNDKTILDVGCGNAWVAGACLPENKLVISMDISTVNTKKALERYPSEKHFPIVADSYNLPFKTNSIDCIIAAEILEHTADPTLFIKKLYEVLKPGGKLIITTPYHEKLEYSLCVHCNTPTPRHAHLHSFHEKNITSMIPKGASFTATHFMNKYLIKLNTHILLKYLPLNLWKKIDRFSEILRPAALRFIVELTKPTD